MAKATEVSGATMGVGLSGEAAPWYCAWACIPPKWEARLAEVPPGRPSTEISPAAACKMSAMQKDGFLSPEGSKEKQPPAPGPAGVQYAADHRLKLEA